MAEPDPIVKELLATLEPGRTEQQTRVKKFDRSYDVYRASQPRDTGEVWRSRLRVPYARQVIDTAMVNVVSGQPRIVVRPRHSESAAQAKAMQVLLDYYVGEDHLVEKQPQFVQQGLIFGVTAAKVHWLYKTEQRPGRGLGPDGLVGGQVDLHELVVRDGPTFEPWDVYRCFWEPGARDVDAAGYIVLQTYLSKDEARRNECTTDHRGNPEARCTGLYHNVDALLASGAGPQPQQTAQQRANKLAGDMYRYKDKFLIEEIWTDDTLTVLGNKQVLLRRQPNPYWHGRKPVVVAQTMPDLFELEGISETEAVEDLQQAQWTLQNMVVDNLHLTVMRGITYRENGVTDPNALQLKPRFKWPVQDHDDIKPFEVAPISSDVFTERQRLLADMQLVTGINPYVSGSDLATVDQNTATGVTALQEVASRLLRFKAAMVHYKGYQRAFEMWGDMAQQFFEGPQQVEILGPGNAGQWVELNAGDVVGHFNYVLEGSEESLSRQQERGEAVALLNAFAPLAPLGIINFPAILEKVAAAYNFPNPEALINPPAPPPQQAAPAPPGGQQQPQQPGFNDQVAQQLFNVRGPQIGAGVAGRDRYQQQGGLQMDPRLANALALLPQR